MDKQITREYLDEKINGVLEAMNYGFEEAKKDRIKIKKKVDETYILLDSYVKVNEAFKQEFVILKEKVRRIEEKLGLDV